MPAVTNPATLTTPIKTALAKQLLRTREAAAYLSVSAWKLRRLIRDRLLPIVQENEGAAWRVDVRDLDAYVERHKRTEPL